MNIACQTFETVLLLGSTSYFVFAELTVSKSTNGNMTDRGVELYREHVIEIDSFNATSAPVPGLVEDPDILRSLRRLLEQELERNREHIIEGAKFEDEL